MVKYFIQVERKLFIKQNTLLFLRYEEEEESPKEVKFIDFQSSRISSLVTDLLTFTFTSMPSNLRREYINEMLEVAI